MMAPAAVCWGSRLGLLHFTGTRLAFVENPITLGIFTLFAAGELFADKLPKAPSRLAPPGLITRLVFGAACAGALAVSERNNAAVAGILGAAGAVAGAFGGYTLRHWLTSARKLPDLPVALVEDVAAIAGAALVVTHI